MLWIREDLIILKHAFFDQDGKLVKELTTTEIRPIGGKLYGTLVRMVKADMREEWTEVRYREAKFGIELAESFFTLSNLRNPRQ
jgi:D-alanine-D-alanine ligase-like ATP-grasp enzyme